MRSFNSLALRQVRARRSRALLTAAGIVLGVGMVLGVLLLSATIQRTFTDLFDTVYGRADLVVAGGAGTSGSSLPERAVARIARTEGVSVASGRVLSQFALISGGGRDPQTAGRLNVAGVDPDAPRLGGQETVGGRDPARGREIALQASFAAANGIVLGDRVRVATPSGIEGLAVVGLFRFPTELDFGGQGFAVMPIDSVRRLTDKRGAVDEVSVAVDGGPEEVERVERRLRRALPRGTDISTPAQKGEEVQSQLQGFNVVLYFFAAMALFVGGFLIFNSFNMTVLQRTRQIGMLRTLGATRAMVSRSVLLEALVLGTLGSALGVAVGLALALALIELMRALDFPIGGLRLTFVAFAAAVATGMLTAMLGALRPASRAGRTSPIRAVLGTEGLRRRPGPRRAAGGLTLIVAGLAGAFWLGAAEQTTTVVIAAGMGGTIAIFFGIALVAPFVVAPLVGVLSAPLRLAFPIEGRMAADAARSDPGRTASTATAVTIGLALVVAVNSLGSSFLGTISDELDRAFARDLTVQPRGFIPGQGPQPRIAAGLRDRLARIPEAEVVARERLLHVSELPHPPGREGRDGLLLAFDPDRYAKVDQTEIEGAPRARVFRRLEGGAVTLGRAYAEDIDAAVGDVVGLSGPSGAKRVRVAGIVDTVVFGGRTVGMSLRTMRQVWGVTSDSQLALKATSPEARSVLRRKVERVVASRYPNLTVLSNEDLKADVEERVNQQFGIFYAIVGVAIFASLFGIVNTLSMSVLERTREIGVLRALGATRWQVRRATAYESLVIGLIGALLGMAVGTGLGYALLQGLASDISGVTYRPLPETMAAVAVAGVLLGLLAAVVPARRAARLNVIGAIGYE